MVKKKAKKSAIKIFIGRTTGIALFLFSLLLLASLFFFNATDPSLNVATSAKASNFFGLFGAQSAAFIIFWFGLSLPLFLPAPLCWGLYMAFGKEVINLTSRFFAFLFGTMFASVFFSLVQIHIETFRLGGDLGYKLSEMFLSFVNLFYHYPYAEEILCSIFFVLALLCFDYAIGITYRHWWKVLKFIALCTAKLASILKNGILWTISHKKRIELKRNNKVATLKLAAKKKQPEEVTKKAEPKVIINKMASEEDYQKPSVNLLSKPKEKLSGSISEKDLQKNAQDLERVLQEFGVEGKIVKVSPGPVVTLYELEPAPGIKTVRVVSLADDIAREMSVSSVRIAVVPRSNTIGIEMPNTTRDIVWLRELFEDENFVHSSNTLNIVLGKDIGGKNIYADLAKMPHLLVAGTTGSGKSVGVNSMILSILYTMTPKECKFIMIDPKMLELSIYNGIPHLLTPVITDPTKAVIGLKWAVKEMEDRYRAMATLNVRNISGYNKKLEEIRQSGKSYKRTVQTGFDKETGEPIYEDQEIDLTPLPYIVIVVDEMADLMLVAGKDVEAAIQRLAQMARAAGIHLIMSTQRPSVDVITGTIKANFPTRISFQVTSKIDSRTILGEQGAEQLLGMGDMLYMPAGLRPVRIHGSYVKDKEVEDVVSFLKNQKAPEYIEGVTDGELNSKKGSAVFDNTEFGSGERDELYEQAVEIVRNDKKASTSYIQRRLGIGYNKAATIIEKMEAEGVVSIADHVGRREVL